MEAFQTTPQTNEGERKTEIKMNRKNKQKNGTRNYHTQKNRTHHRRRKLYKPENATTKYTIYIKGGVYEWAINASKKNDGRNPHPCSYRDEEFE